MDSWTKVRIEIAGRSAKLYLNGSVKPSLAVDGLKGEDLHGGVVFFQPADCASRAAELENGSDVAGFWEMRRVKPGTRISCRKACRRSWRIIRKLSRLMGKHLNGHTSGSDVVERNGREYWAMATICSDSGFSA